MRAFLTLGAPALQPSPGALDLLRGAAWIVLAALVLAGLAMAWSWSLQKQVRQRTEALRRATGSIRENEHFLATILETMPLALYGKDPADQFRYWLWNAKAEELFGLPREAVLGRSDYELFPRDQADRFRAGDLEALARGGSVELADDLFWSKGHGLLHLQTIKTAILSVAGQPSLLLGLSQNLTAQKLLEQELQRSRESLAKAQALAGVGNWQWEVASDEVTWSDQLYRQLGLEPGAVLPSFRTVLARIHPADRWLLRKSMRRFERGQDRPPVDFRVLQLDGSIRFVQSNIEVERDADDKAIRLVGTFQDMTERLITEEAFRQTQKLESLGVLAGGIAHDFNNLLSAIGGNLELARLNMAPEPAASPFLVRIEKILRRAAQLTHQMLAYSGKGHFVIKPINLNQVAEDMPNLLEVSISKRVLLQYRLEPELELIEADPAQIQQVIMNLVTNASEAIGDQDGTIILRTGMESLSAPLERVDNRGWAIAPGRYVTLEVADTGCGMSEDTLGKLFDPFFTTKFSGRGLGLSAMLGILRGHQAGIRIQSRPGEGSTFTLYFPASAVRESAEPPVVMTLAVPGAVAARLLVVDDEPDILEACVELLTTLGYSVCQAQDGLEALELFRQDPHAIDLVLMDLTMPRMDGKEALRAMRALDPDVKVVLCSGFNEADVTKTFPYSSLSGFLQKPYTFQTLKEVIQQGLEG